MSIRHNDSLGPVRNTAVGERKKEKGEKKNETRNWLLLHFLEKRHCVPLFASTEPRLHKAVPVHWQGRISRYMLSVSAKQL